MKAIGYIRVSTEEQSADDKYGIEVQKQAISDYADRNDFEIVCWLTDTISGAKDNRPELDKILYNADQLPAYEAVIVFKNDRVARDTKLYFYYFYTLEKRNVKLLSTEEHFSEGDDFANIYRSLLMFVAEQERKNIALRTGRGRSQRLNVVGIPAAISRMVITAWTVCSCKTRKNALSWRRYSESMTRITPLCWTFARFCTMVGIEPEKARDFSRPPFEESYLIAPSMRGKYKYGDMGWVQGVHSPDSPIGGVEMKKILSIMLTGVLMLAVSGCGAEPQHKVSYVSGEKLTVLEQYDCVAVYTQSTPTTAPKLLSRLMKCRSKHFRTVSNCHRLSRQVTELTAMCSVIPMCRAARPLMWCGCSSLTMILPYRWSCPAARRSKSH